MIKLRMPTKNKFILSVSYGNHVRDLGGTNKVILEHQDMLKSAGMSHVHIFPQFIRVPVLNYYCLRRWGVVIDGLTLDQYYTTQEVVHMLGSIIAKNIKLTEIHLHHLKSIKVRDLKVLLDLFRVPIKFYIHDYYTICYQHNLLNDKNNYCGKGAVSAEKCNTCKYFFKSKKHSETIRNFLERYKKRVRFIIPSTVARDIWASAYGDYVDQIDVVYHQKLLGKYKCNCEIVSSENPVRVAYVGSQQIIKGWLQWLKATTKAYELGCHEVFYHFGNTSDMRPYLKKVPVYFNRGNLNEMIDCLRENSIDVAVLWSVWPETYSYTYFECAAANTFIITNKNSGNIAAMVKERNNGIVLDDYAELETILCDEIRLRKIVNNFKLSRTYGPSRLEENRDILQLMTEGNCSSKFNLPIYKDTFFSSAKRWGATKFYSLHQFVKRIKNG